MKIALTVAVVLVSLLGALDVSAACQACSGDNTMCVTLTGDETAFATMNACVVKEEFDKETGEVVATYCDGMGSQPPAECFPSEWSEPGGNGEDMQNGGGSGGECTWDGGCPAQCRTCN